MTSTEKNLPTVIAWVENLMFASRIESAVETLGFSLEFIENADEMIPSNSQG